MRLIITNGDSAAATIKQANIEADILPWRDILHDGPVPHCETLQALSEIRADFIARSGWGDFQEVHNQFISRDNTLQSALSYQEVILWFEHDLYDQLQLWQLLSWFSGQQLGNCHLTMICKDRFVSEIPAAELPEEFAGREAVTQSQLSAARQAWPAFTAESPEKLFSLFQTGENPLPFMITCLNRLLEEYPSHSNGLSRNEQQILQLVADGLEQPVEIFQAAGRLESAPYLGDWSFWSYIQVLLSGESPLLKTGNGSPFQMPASGISIADFKQQTLFLTDAGRQVLAGQKDWLKHYDIDRWIGGVHLSQGNIWRWDAYNKSLFFQQ